MKKILAILLVFLLLLSGCGNTKKEKETETSTSPQTEDTNNEDKEDEEVPKEDEVTKEESEEESKEDVVADKETEQNGEVTIYLTRHGKTMLNTSDRVQGWSDSPLTEAGVEVALKLGKGLKADDIKFVAAYSSDSGRAIETANIVLTENGQIDELELMQKKELREWNFGIFEGDLNSNMVAAATEASGYEGEEDIRVALTLDELADAIAKADKEGLAENSEQISTRTKEGFDSLVKEVSENGGGNVLVVAHGLTINSILKNIDENHKTVQFANASVTKIIYADGEYKVEFMNDTSYTEE